MSVEMKIDPSVFNRKREFKGTPDNPGSIPNVGDDPVGGRPLVSSGEEDAKLFSPPGPKLTLGSLDDTSITVSAQYNPREIQVVRAVPWQSRMSPEVNKLTVEFTGEEGRTLNFDLLFDGYEENLSIRDQILKLRTLSRATVAVDRRQHMLTTYDEEQKKAVAKNTLTTEEDKEAYIKSGQQQKDDDEIKKKGKDGVRPHFCALTWGHEWLSDPFRGVIQSINVRYTMFSEDGEPLRATVSLAMREAHDVGLASEADRKTFAEKQRMMNAEATNPLNLSRQLNEYFRQAPPPGQPK